MLRRLVSQRLHGQHEEGREPRALLRDRTGNFTLDIKNTDRMSMTWKILAPFHQPAHPELTSLSTYDCTYEFTQSPSVFVTNMRLIVAEHQNREYTSADRIIEEQEEREILLRFRIAPIGLALGTIHKQQYTGLDFRLMFEGEIDAITHFWDKIRMDFVIESIITRGSHQHEGGEPPSEPPAGRHPPSRPRRPPSGREPPREDW